MICLKKRGVDFGVSIALMILGIPISFVFWYRPFYVAVQYDFFRDHSPQRNRPQISLAVILEKIVQLATSSFSSIIFVTLDFALWCQLEFPLQEDRNKPSPLILFLFLLWSSYSLNNLNDNQNHTLEKWVQGKRSRLKIQIKTKNAEDSSMQSRFSVQVLEQEL